MGVQLGTGVVWCQPAWGSIATRMAPVGNWSVVTNTGRQNWVWVTTANLGTESWGITVHWHRPRGRTGGALYVVGLGKAPHPRITLAVCGNESTGVPGGVRVTVSVVGNRFVGSGRGTTSGVRQGTAL